MLSEFMKNGWFPEKKEDLEKLLEKLILGKKKNVHGLIVPHAGYKFSGKIAGRAYGLLKDVKRVVVLGPSHYVGFRGVRVIEKIETPLGKVKIMKNSFQKIDYDHSVINQIPFLQKINPNVEILPLVVGEVDVYKAREIVSKLIDLDVLFIFSTDLSHFKEYSEANEIDRKSIDSILDLDISSIDACGLYPLIIMQELCKLRGWKPKLITYKNSGDIIGEKDSVVGYAAFEF